MKGNKEKLSTCVCPVCKEEFLCRAKNQLCCSSNCRTIHQNNKSNQLWLDNPKKPKQKSGFKEFPLSPSTRGIKYE